MGDPGHVKTFNRIAPSYDRKFGKDCEQAHEVVMAWASEADLRPGSVLDIGCGTGQLLSAARERWPDATLFGLDPAEAMIGIAARKITGARVEVGVAERLPYPDESMDLVLSTTSFGHWTSHEAGLREAARVLRPGGSCLIAEHAPPGILMRTVLILLNRMPRLCDAAEMTRLVTGAGLRVARIGVVPGGFLATRAVRSS